MREAEREDMKEGDGRKERLEREKRVGRKGEGEGGNLL